MSTRMFRGLLGKSSKRTPGPNKVKKKNSKVVKRVRPEDIESIQMEESEGLGFAAPAVQKPEPQPTKARPPPPTRGNRPPLSSDSMRMLKGGAEEGAAAKLTNNGGASFETLDVGKPKAKVEPKSERKVPKIKSTGKLAVVKEEVPRKEMKAQLKVPKQLGSVHKSNSGPVARTENGEIAGKEVLLSFSKPRESDVDPSILDQFMNPNTRDMLRMDPDSILKPKKPKKQQTEEDVEFQLFSKLTPGGEKAKSSLKKQQNNKIPKAPPSRLLASGNMRNEKKKHGRRAAPDQEYLQTVVDRRQVKSIFRPSSIYIDKAKQEAVNMNVASSRRQMATPADPQEEDLDEDI